MPCVALMARAPIGTKKATRGNGMERRHCDSGREAARRLVRLRPWFFLFQFPSSIPEAEAYRAHQVPGAGPGADVLCSTDSYRADQSPVVREQRRPVSSYV